MAKTIEEKPKIDTFPQMCRDTSNLNLEDLAKCAELSAKFDNEIEDIKIDLGLEDEDILHQMAGYIDYKLNGGGKIEKEIKEKIKEVY